METLYTIIGLFALGALIGMYLLISILQNKETPKFVAFIHGAFVIAGLFLLISYTMTTVPGPVEALVLFIMAALGGLVLVYRDVTKRSIPKWLAVGHGVIAIAGFIFLLVYTFA